MKKLILVAFVLLVGIGGAQVGSATEYVHEEGLQTRAIIKQYFFSQYPPKTYYGMTLIKVEKISGGYRGWYV